MLSPHPADVDLETLLGLNVHKTKTQKLPKMLVLTFIKEK